MEKTLYGLYHKEEDAWWWAVGRRTLIGSLLKKYGNGNGRPRLLEIGCGAGGLLKELSKLGTSYGLDVEQESMKYCRERGLERLCLGDASALPYRAELFDAVICVDVLEHLDDDGAALADIYRVLKPGGRLVATVPAFQSLWSRRDVQLHHKRRYRLGERGRRGTGPLPPEEGAIPSVAFALRPAPINRVLAGVAALESRLAPRVNLPLGSSIV